MTEPVTPIRIVYLGKRKEGHAFIPEQLAEGITDVTELLLRASWFAFPKAKGLTVASVYEVEKATLDEGGGLARLAPPVWGEGRGIWDHPLRLVLQERNRAEELAKRADSDAKVRELEKLLLPLRREYQRTNHMGRLAMEVQILAALRSNPRS